MPPTIAETADLRLHPPQIVPPADGKTRRGNDQADRTAARPDDLLDPLCFKQAANTKETIAGNKAIRRNREAERLVIEESLVAVR